MRKRKSKLPGMEEKIFKCSEAVSLNILSPLNVSDYYSDGYFLQDLHKFQRDSNRFTGFSNLDSLQRLYPGLYVLGAISSLGKTTFALQLANQLASFGEFVLYFSLEQNYLELFSKSLSRFCYQLWLDDSSKPIFSSMDIRRGIPMFQHSTYFEEQIQSYVESVGKNFSIVACNFSATIEDIIQSVENFMEANKQKPIVIVDYLQIISQTLVNGRPGNIKTNIDHIVHALKCFQSSHDLVVIVISSLNRQNYMTPMDFESFKESGGIEYTADVVWGLQLSVINDELFSKEGRVKDKRELIRKAKVSNPRSIQLVCLKNRYGVSNYSVMFDYFPAYDVFIPVEE